MREGGGPQRRQQCVESSEHERYHYMQIISERVGGEATHTSKSPAAGTRPLIVGWALRSPGVDRLSLLSDLKSLARPVVVVM